MTQRPTHALRQVCALVTATGAARSISRSLSLLALAAPLLAGAQLPPPPVSPAPIVKLEYDAQGNFRRSVQAPGVADLSTSHDHDRLHRRFKTTDARGKATLMGYNGREDLLSVTDPRGLVTQYPRNGLGDLSSLQSPDTGTALHTYDSAGNLLTRLDSRGVLASYSHDALNRLTRIDYGPSGSPEQSIVWNYDQTGPGFSNGKGRLTSTQYTGGYSSYAYDPQGRLFATTQTSTAASSVSHTVSYGYDAAGRITSITYPSGRKLHITLSGGLPTSLAIAPDAASAAVPLVSGLQFEPVPGGQGPARSWVWHLDGGILAHQREFDVHGRMIRYPLGGAVRSISYDAADRISSYIHHNAISGSAVPSLDQSFGYDELGRLKTVNTSVGNWTYHHDDNGNRTQLTSVVGGVSTARAHTIDAFSNRLLSIANPARSFEHDPAGNTESDQQGSSRFYAAYDPSGRMVETRSSANAVNFKVLRYAHNAQGQRVFKEDFAQENCSASGMCSTLPIINPINTVFVYDQEGRLLGEYSGSTGTVNREYVWLQGMPVAVIDGTPASPVIAYVHTDHLDTPRTVIDRLGRQRWTWIAEPFGNSAPSTNPLGFGNYELNLRMPGQYFDAETGVSDNWHRVYDAGLGRYTQSDPIGLAGGINTYAYVENNPLSYVDPEGLQGIRPRPGIPGFPVPGRAPGGMRDPDFPPGVGPNQMSTSSGTGAGRSTATPATSSAQCPPECEASPPRSQAMVAAYSWAGIPIGGAGTNPIPWNNFNMPSGMSRGGREYGDFMRTYYPKNYGYSTPGGALVVEHPFGHPDQPGPAHHACPHFHAKNAAGVEKIFTYKPGS